MWDAHVRRFAADYRCLRPDFPGFGDSASEPWVSIDQVAAEIAGVIRALAKGPAHVVGLSLGGLVALRILGEAPDLVDRVVVDGSSVLPIFGLPVAKVALRAVSPLMKTKPVVETIGRMIGIPQGEMEGLRRDYRRMSTAAFTEACCNALDFRQRGLEHARSPTLLVAGDREWAAVLASNRFLARIMPNATARVVPGRTHSWIAGEPELHGRMVEAWLNGRTLPPELADADA